VLYHLATGRPLWKTDVHDDVVPRDLKQLAKGEARKLMADFQRAVGRNASQDQLTAKDLVAKLLEPDAKRRLDEDHLPDMQAVLQKHPFLQTKDLSDATLATIKAQNNRILEGVEALRDLTEENLDELKSTRKAIMKGIYEATEVMTPTAFVILKER